MKKLLAVAAFAALSSASLAFDVTDYTVENLVELSELEAVTAAGVRCRGVLHDPTNPDQVLLFAQEGTDVWFLTYDLGTETLSVIGNDTVNNLKGDGTSVVRGAFAAGDGLIVYHDGASFGTLNAVDVATGTFIPNVVVDTTNLGTLASLSYLGNDLWVGGQSLDDTNGAAMDLLLINSDTGAVTVLETLNSMQDVVAIGSDRALVADGWNRRLFDATGIGGTYSSTNITPAGFGFPEPRTMKGMTALSEDFYILLDNSPADFDNDILAVWDGTSMTDLVLSDIAAPGLLYPNFHTGLTLVQPDPDTINLYIANFNNFAAEPALVRLTWTQDTETSVRDWMMH
ncbi:MAG: hypothetical protein JJU11_05225 [Candidatus Sumerlaeia bacterium]|nr:hypothetical protein [Candidatus Sumerlaeia bacterium]